MNLNNCTFARPIAKLSDALIRDLEEHGPEGLSEQHDALLTMAAGVAPGRPEVFTSCAARDAALGDYGPYTQFVRASWNEASAAGFEVQDIAIGHHLGDPAFDLIAPQVLDAVARGMAESGEHRYIGHCQGDLPNSCHAAAKSPSSAFRSSGSRAMPRKSRPPAAICSRSSWPVWASPGLHEKPGGLVRRPSRLH